jgi:hypothetical protein
MLDAFERDTGFDGFPILVSSSIARDSRRVLVCTRTWHCSVQVVSWLRVTHLFRSLVSHTEV